MENFYKMQAQRISVLSYVCVRFNPNFCVFFLISQVCEISGIAEQQFNKNKSTLIKTTPEHLL